VLGKKPEAEAIDIISKMMNKDDVEKRVRILRKSQEKSEQD
jgi:hypothetical protein